MTHGYQLYSEEFDALGSDGRTYKITPLTSLSPKPGFGMNAEATHARYVLDRGVDVITLDELPNGDFRVPGTDLVLKPKAE